MIPAAAALVTGAGSGIGRAAACKLAADGWKVWVTDIDVEAARAVADGIDRRGGVARFASCDVTEQSELDDLAGRIRDDEGGLRAVVANAAVFPRRSLDETDAAIARSVLAVNVVGVVATVVAMRPLLAEHGGSLVLVTSGSSARTIARTGQQRGFALYGASKAALERWALGVCDELAADGIVMQLLCPGGVVETDGTVAVLDPDERRDAVGVDVVAAAIARLCRTRDVAHAGARHLATELR